MDEISEKSRSSATRSKNNSVSAKNSSSKQSRQSTVEENKRREKERQRSKNFHPIKLVIPPNKSRLIFFSKYEDQQQWRDWLQEAMGYSNVFQYYTLDKTLGKAQGIYEALAKDETVSERLVNILGLAPLVRSEMEEADNLDSSDNSRHSTSKPVPIQARKHSGNSNSR